MVSRDANKMQVLLTDLWRWKFSNNVLCGKSNHLTSFSNRNSTFLHKNKLFFVKEHVSLGKRASEFGKFFPIADKHLFENSEWRGPKIIIYFVAVCDWTRQWGGTSKKKVAHLSRKSALISPSTWPNRIRYTEGRKKKDFEKKKKWWHSEVMLRWE